jgi:uncharacterized peroxidase-related enzyme
MSGVRADVVGEAQASGEVADLYDDLRELFFGHVPDVFKLVSTRPDMLRTLVTGYRSMFDGGHLPREAKEVIALTVARTESCRFCTAAHDFLLRAVGAESRFADAIAAGRLDDPIIHPDVRALASLAVSITENAYRLTDEDLDEVAGNGWSREQVLEAVWVACLFNAIVRLADALGLHSIGQLTENSQDTTQEAR